MQRESAREYLVYSTQANYSHCRSKDAYQMFKILNLGQAVVVQLQLLKVDQALQVINLDNVLEAKSQVLNVFVRHCLLLLLCICAARAGPLQAMRLPAGGLWFAATNLYCQQHVT